MLDNLIRLFEELINKKFYGEVVIKMEAGKVVIIKKTESIKLS